MIPPSAVLRTARLPGTSAVSAAGTPPTIAAPTSVVVMPTDEASGPATTKPTGMMTMEMSMS